MSDISSTQPTTQEFILSKLSDVLEIPRAALQRIPLGESMQSSFRNLAKEDTIVEPMAALAV